MPALLALELSLAAYAMIVVITGGILWLVGYAIFEQRKPSEIIPPTQADAAPEMLFEVAVKGDGEQPMRWIRTYATSADDAMRRVAAFGDAPIEARPAQDRSG